MTRLFLWGSIIWLPPLLCYLLGNETKFKKGIAVGVTFPIEGRMNEEVLGRLAAFRRELKVCCLVLMAMVVPCLFLPGMSATMAVWMLWLLIVCVAPYVLYARCNRHLRRIKQEHGWAAAKSSAVVVVDTEAMEEPRWLSPALFLLPLCASLLPLLRDRSFAVAYLVDAGCIAFFWLCYRFLYRNRAERADGDIALSRALTEVRRHGWGQVWILSSWAMALLNGALMLAKSSEFWFWCGTLLVTLGLCSATVAIELRVRRAQERLTENLNADPLDEDDLWIWGLLYYNPRDSHCFVNDRVGVNTSVNLAHPAGKVIAAALVLLILSLSLTLIFLDGKPPVLSVREETLVAASGRRSYEVALEDIVEVELREALPQRLWRSYGTATESLLRGKFTSEETGNVTLCLDPTAPPYLLITTEGGQRYLLGSSTEDETLAVFELLRAQ